MTGFLLDAGPSLNFLAVGQESALIELARANGTTLAAPERVDREVRGKARSARFERTAVARKWPQLTGAGHVEILDDDTDRNGLGREVALASGMPASQRIRDKKSLGEIMVIAHASVLARAGHTAFVLIDESDGQKRARAAKDRVEMDASCTGTIKVVSTQLVLRTAGRHGWLRGGESWQEVYRSMMPYDDGLIPLS